MSDVALGGLKLTLRSQAQVKQSTSSIAVIGITKCCDKNDGASLMAIIAACVASWRVPLSADRTWDLL
jgi:hypothetical protein